MAEREGYFDRANEQWIDSQGRQINRDQALPYIKYREQLTFTLNIKTVDSDGTVSNYTEYATGGPYSYKFVLDNDRTHYIDGALENPITAGAITQIDIKSLGTTPLNSGKIKVTNSAGNSEVFTYTAATDNTTYYTFTVSATATYSYAADDDADVVEPALVEVENSAIDDTDAATGKFVLTMDANTIPYQQAAEGLAEIANTLFEFQVLDAGGDLVDAFEGDWRALNLLFDELSNPPQNTVSDYYNKTQTDARYLQREDFNTSSAEAVTLSSDSATLTKNVAELTSESGVTDDLATISSAQEGDRRWLYPTSGHTITIKHGTGNIITPSAADVNMAGNGIYSFYYDGSNWRLEAQIQASGSGDVTGPGSSTDNAVARFDLATGKLLQNSVVLIDDSGAITGVTGITVTGNVSVTDDAYAVGWNGSTNVPTKNAVYDKIEDLDNDFVQVDFTGYTAKTTLDDSDWLIINDPAGTVKYVPASLFALDADIPSGIQEIATLATDVNDPLKNNYPVTYQIDETSQDVPSEYVLLCHFSGSDGDTAFVDRSDFAHTITSIGDPEVDTDITKFGATIIFDGNDGIRIIDDNCDFGANDFHISCWLYIAAGAGSNDQTIWHLGSGDGTTEVINARIENGEIVHRFTQTAESGWGETLRYLSQTVSEETWYHFGLERSGNSLFVLFNGIVLDEYDMTGKTLKAPDGTSNFRWAAGWNGSAENDFFTGNMDETVIVIGATVIGLNSGDTTYTVPTTQYYTDQVYDISDSLSPDSASATFANGDLTSNYYDFAHNLATEVLHITVFEDASPDAIIIPDSREVVDSNTTRIRLDSFVPISGNWRVIATR